MTATRVERSRARAGDAPDVAVGRGGGRWGALARYAVQAAWPRPPVGFGAATVGINVTGCLVIGPLCRS